MHREQILFRCQNAKRSQGINSDNRIFNRTGTTRGRRINDLSLATTNKMWSSDHLSFSVQWELHRATTKLIPVVIQLRGLLANQHDFLSYRWRDFSPPWIDPLCRCGSGSRRTRPLSMLLLPFCTVAPTDLAAHLPDTPDFSHGSMPLAGDPPSHRHSQHRRLQPVGWVWWSKPEGKRPYGLHIWFGDMPYHRLGRGANRPPSVVCVPLLFNFHSTIDLFPLSHLYTQNQLSIVANCTVKEDTIGIKVWLVCLILYSFWYLSDLMNK